MAVDEIRIDAGPGETRAVFLEAGELVRAVVDRDAPGPRAGDIYAGRVTALVDAIDAAFVDIGDERAGFLGLPEARPAGAASGRIRDHLHEGEAIVVQVLRGADAGKGAKLTRRPALAGRFVVYLPGEAGVRLSRRIADRAEGERIAAVLPREAGGWLVRRAAADATPEMLNAEVARLCGAWHRADTGVAPPARLARGPSDLITTLRDEATPALKRIVVDDSGTAAAVRAAVPDLADRVVAVVPGTAFADDDLAERFDALLSPVIPLPSGGVVTVTPTPGLIAVDVDTGTARSGAPDATALAVDREAVVAVARRLRAADLAGYVVIDAVPLRRPGHRDAVLADLRRAVAEDPRPVRIGGWTALGRIELTRRREGPSLFEQLTAPCPVCEGAGRVDSPATTALAALRTVLAEDRARPGRALRLRASPTVIARLRGPEAAALARTEERLGRPVALRSDAALAPDAVRIEEAAITETEAVPDGRAD